MTDSPAVVRRAGLGSRLVGLLADLVLFTLFLFLGLSALNVLIAGIVLVVGIVQGGDVSTINVDAATVRAGTEIRETVSSGRLTEDLTAIGLAIAQAIVATILYVAYRRLRRRYLHVFGSGSFESFVSKRYLIARGGGRLVGLITGVSIVGVSVGVMALIVVISVMEGFDQSLVRKFMGVFSHVQVLPDPRLAPGEHIPDDVAADLILTFEQEPFVLGVAPILEHETIVQRSLSAQERFAFVRFRGVDPERERNVTEFIDYVEEGEAIPSDGEVVVGRRLAETLNLRPGDPLYAIGKPVQTASRVVTKNKELRVVGIFHSGLYDVDDKFVYTTIPTVRDMLLMDEGVSTIHMRVDNPDQVERYVYTALLPALPRDYGLRTWQMLNPLFFNALQTEKIAMFIILLLIVLVASFNIIGTLVMTVVQKTRDIGVFKSMGASRFSIMKIFLYHGFMIGLLGTSLGVVWGLRLCWFVEEDIDKIFQLPGGVYGIDRLPVVVDPGLIVFIAFCALVICMLASIIPAFQASRLDPVEALRYD